MANCFVLRASIDSANNMSATVRGIGCTERQMTDAVQVLLAHGHIYKMVNPHGALDKNMESAGDVFDAMNEKGVYDNLPVHMAVGDVIVWNNGKRELCLPDGWAIV